MRDKPSVGQPASVVVHLSGPETKDLVASDQVHGLAPRGYSPPDVMVHPDFRAKRV